MPAKSQRQHGFMGYVLQYKLTGRLPRKIKDPDLILKIKLAAKRMTIKQIKDFLETKKSKLPRKKRKRK